MRPLHALFVVVALVLVCGLSWILIRSDDSGGQVAPASHGAAVPGEVAAVEPLEAELVASGEREQPLRAAQEQATEAKRPSAVAADRPSAARTEIAGRVIDAQGRALGGVHVMAAGATPFLRGARLDEIDRARTPWMRIVETETAADGRFVLAVSDEAEANLALRRAGHAPYDANVPLRVGERRDLGDLTLESGVVLEGRVVDAGGRGIAGAQLRRVREDEGLSFSSIESKGASLALTDDGGGFRIDQLPAGAWRVQVEHELHPDAVFEGETERAGDVSSGLVFELEDGLAIRGRVLGAPDDVLEGLEVSVSPEIVMSESSPRDRPAVRRRVKPAADGGFVVQGLRQGERYRLQGRASDGRGDLFGRSYTNLVVAEPGERAVDLVFRPETAIVFQVVDDATDEPLTRFDVTAGLQFSMPQIDDRGRMVREHPEGRVRFGNLNATSSDRLALSVDAVGYEGFERDDIALASGRDNDLGVIRLVAAPTVTVRVVDDRTNAPIEGAAVRLSEVRSPGVIEAGMHSESIEMDITVGEEGDMPLLFGGGSQMQRTDADGVARLTSLPGTDARLAVSAKGYAPFTSATLRLPEGKDYEHDVRLGPGASVVVRVVDSDGAAVPGVEVAHEAPGGKTPTLVGGNVTDAAGENRFENLAPGRHAFRIGRGDSFVAMSPSGDAVMRMSRTTRGGPAPRSDDWVEVELMPGMNEPVVLTAPTRTEIVGVVTEGGRPLAGAKVALVEPGAEPHLAMLGGDGGPESRTNGRGEYVLSGVEVGKHRIEITHATRAMPYALEVDVDEGDNEVDVDLPLTAIKGVVVDLEGEPVAGARVVAKRAESGGERRAMRMVFVSTDGNDTTSEIIDGDAFDAAMTDAEGRYELRGVTPDQELVVEATHADAQPARSDPLHVAPGETREDIDLELQPGGRLTVLLERPDGSGAAMHLVSARFDEQDGVEPKTSVTGSDGRASFDGLRPGRWRFECQALGRPGGAGEEIPPAVVDVVVGENPQARVPVP